MNWREIYSRYIKERIPMPFWYRRVWLPVAQRRPVWDRRVATRIIWKLRRVLERLIGYYYGEPRASAMRFYYERYGLVMPER